MRGAIAVILIIIAFGLACLASGAFSGIPVTSGPLFTLGIDSGALDATSQALASQAAYRRTQEAAPRVTAQAETAQAFALTTAEASYRHEIGTATAEAEGRVLQLEIIRMTADSSDAQNTATAQAVIIQTADASSNATLEAGVRKTEVKATSQAIENKARADQVTSMAWSLFWLLLPVSLLVLVVTIIARFAWHKTELSVIRADSTGKYPLMIRSGKIINGNLQSQPVMDAKQPAPAPSELELHVKDNEQKIDTIRALPRNAPAPVLPESAGQGFLVLSQNALPPERLMPDPGTASVVDGDWRNS